MSTLVKNWLLKRIARTVRKERLIYRSPAYILLRAEAQFAVCNADTIVCSYIVREHHADSQHSRTQN